jgi:hypothetical protein
VPGTFFQGKNVRGRNYCAGNNRAGNDCAGDNCAGNNCGEKKSCREQLCWAKLCGEQLCTSVNPSVLALTPFSLSTPTVQICLRVQLYLHVERSEIDILCSLVFKSWTRPDKLVNQSPAFYPPLQRWNS